MENEGRVPVVCCMAIEHGSGWIRRRLSRWKEFPWGKDAMEHDGRRGGSVPDLLELKIGGGGGDLLRMASTELLSSALRKKPPCWALRKMLPAMDPETGP